MEKMSLCEGVVAQMIENEAWQNLSSEFPFSLEQLEKYADRLDWEMVSGNKNIFWTVAMLEKFKNRIHWDKLANSYNAEEMAEEILEKFKDRWDWNEFSESGNLTPAIVEKYADRLCWKKLIDNWNFIDSNKMNLSKFVEKYQDRIPGSDFKNSRFWTELVSEKQIEIKKAISTNQL